MIEVHTFLNIIFEEILHWKDHKNYTYNFFSGINGKVKNQTCWYSNKNIYTK